MQTISFIQIKRVVVFCRGEWKHIVNKNFNRLVRYSVGRQQWNHNGMTEQDKFFVRLVQLTVPPSISTTKIKKIACQVGKLAVSKRAVNVSKFKASLHPSNFQDKLRASKFLSLIGHI